MLIGIHDCPDTLENFINSESQYSWIKAFKKIKNKKIFLRVDKISKNKDRDIIQKTTPTDSWFESLKANKPKIIFFNICFYSEALSLIKIIKRSLPEVQLVTRVHHDVSYLKSQEGFVNFVKNSDIIITATNSQKNILKKICGESKIYFTLPFGVDIKEFMTNSKRNKRNIDIASAANPHPARNYKIILDIFSSFQYHGFNTFNFYKIERNNLKIKLKEVHFFLLSSLTEASGSRILLEAISSGCYPIVLNECKTAVEVIEELGYGIIIKSNFNLLMPQKVVSTNLFKRFIFKYKLKRIIQSRHRFKVCNSKLRRFIETKKYNFDDEVTTLQKIINKILKNDY